MTTLNASEFTTDDCQLQWRERMLWMNSLFAAIIADPDVTEELYVHNLAKLGVHLSEEWVKNMQE